MIYVARQEIRVESIVKWLNSQRLYNGGWASTQVRIRMNWIDAVELF